eukprot:gene31496-40902_t
MSVYNPSGIKLTFAKRSKFSEWCYTLCGTTPCMVCGSEQIKQTIEKHLGIHEGKTTPDGLFTLRECVITTFVTNEEDHNEPTCGVIRRKEALIAAIGFD